MKQFIISIALLLATTTASAGNIVFRFHSGLQTETLRKNMETQISNLLTEIDNAAAEERTLSLENIKMTASARTSLGNFWNNFRFSCDSPENIEKCITDVNGYEVRNIPVTLKPVDEGYKGELSKELTISFTRDGEITGVHMALANNVYHEIMTKGRDFTDVRRRAEILKFVEEFRSYYDEKDLNALNNIYSEDALIITGKVVMKKAGGDSPQLKPEIVYTKQNKTQYLTNLARTFRNNKYIRVTFDNIRVMRHGAKPQYYGVTLHQHWKSSNYEDDGYVFLLWEFPEDENQSPTIHVRTWQPDQLGGEPLNEKEIINMNDFLIQ